jgi:hypothetical protein
METPSPIEELVPPEKREKLRATVLEDGFYSPWLHLGVTTLVGGSIVVTAICLLHRPTVWQILFGVGLFIFSNAFEWRIHRDVLHHRQKFAPALYDQHTPMHHVLFYTDDMAVRNRREWRLVLIPAFGIVAAAVGLLPGIVLIWRYSSHNLACIFAIETLGYIVSYELLHLSYHLDPKSPIGSLKIIGVLRRHHALHHDPRLMQRWNFNVSLPLWDWVRGTSVRSREEAFARDAERKAARAAS